LKQSNKLISKQHFPLISVIIAVYNGEKYIEQTISSVLNQTYAKMELIIIDGNSTDKTLEVINKYSSQIHFWITEKDDGVYDAWNKGLRQANGDWITFLGADDFFWDSKVVSECVPVLNKALDVNIRFVYGKINLLSASGMIIQTMGNPWEQSKKKITSRMTVVHCAAFHHKNMFSEHGGFNSRFKIAGDYEFILREIMSGREAWFFDHIIAGMRAGGLSANIYSRLTLAKEEVFARQLHSIKPTISDKINLLKANVAVRLLNVFGLKTVNYLLDLVRVIKGKKKMWSKLD
jgi:glycosyltransferase involved in cell wall biosynthesis